MSEVINAGGQDTTLENSEVAAENSEVQGTAAEQDTSTDNDNAADNSDNDAEINGTEEQVDTSSESEEGDSQDSTQPDEVFLSFDDGSQVLRSQAENYAKMGFEFERDTKPILEKLDLILANSQKQDGSGYASLSEFVDGLLDVLDSNLLEQCKEDAHGDETIANELFNSRKAERNKNYTALQEQRAKELKEVTDAKSQKIADEFLRVQTVFPEIKTYGELSSEVKNYAAKNGVSLLEAKLVLDHKNSAAVQKAKEDAQSAADRSTGSQGGQGSGGNSAEVEAMLRGVKY